MTTKDSKLTYEFNNVTNAGGPYIIDIDSSTLDMNDGNSLGTDAAYYVETIVLFSNGSSTQSGATRRFCSFEKFGGTLALSLQDLLESYAADPSRANINHTVSGSNIRIELTTSSAGINQNWRVFVNIKGYS